MSEEKNLPEKKKSSLLAPRSFLLFVVACCFLTTRIFCCCLLLKKKLLDFIVVVVIVVRGSSGTVLRCADVIPLADDESLGVVFRFSPEHAGAREEAIEGGATVIVVVGEGRGDLV